MGKLEENLEKNKQIPEEFKNLARETFKEMLDMLGRERFKKWIKLQTISKDVKSLIYEWADFERENTLRDGDYNRIKNKIRISRNSLNVKKTMRHENFHFFTRGNLLGDFLNEGCTEYLNFLTEKEGAVYAYEENVKVVRFLRELIGDSVIQAYLTGNIKYFNRDLDNILSEKIQTKEKREDLIGDFESDLEEWHHYVYNDVYKDKFKMNKEEYDNTTEDRINDFLRKIITCKFIKMAKERTFNRNGKLDEQLAEQIIREKLKNIKFLGSMDYDQEDRNLTIDGMIENIMSEIKVNCNSKVKVIDDFEWIKSSKRIEKDNFTMDKAFSVINIFEKRKPMSTIEFSDYITKLDTIYNIPKDELREIFEKYAYKNFKDPTQANEVYELIIQNIPRNNAVFDILVNEFTSTESKFRKIGDSEYVEKRDEQFVYIKINDDGTVIQETDLSKVKHIFKIGDNLESIRLINREDDYKELGILGEQEFQQAEMVHLLLDEILYQKNINLQSIVKKMNLLIDDSKLLSRLTETALQKRTRLQVRSLINVLTKDEIEQVTNDIYDEAVLDSGVKDIEHKQEIEENGKILDDYWMKEIRRARNNDETEK